MRYTAADVERALSHDSCSDRGFQGAFISGCCAVPGADGKESGGDYPESFWKYGLYLYTAVYRKLLPELLYLLRIQLLQQYPAEKADV